MENKFCSHCGTPLPGQIPCPNCGAEVVKRETCGSPPPVSDYLVWSIISVLYAGVLGVIALVFSILCRNDMAAGRYDSAVENSNAAFWCNVIPLCLLVFGIGCALVVLTLFVLFA